MHLFYFRSLLWSVTGLLLLAISFNLVLDPFATNRWLDSKGFNVNKPEAITHQCLVKVFEVYRGKPVAISMGSSRTNHGLNIASARWGEDPIYNLGINGASIDDIQHFLAHAMAQGRLKKAIIGLDFFMFNADYIDEGLTNFDNSILSYPGDPNPLREIISMLSIAMSSDTLNGSLAIFFGSLIGFTNDQYSSPSNLSTNQRHEILKGAAHYLDKVYFPKETGRFTFHNQLRGNMLEHFRQILRFCYQHNIELRLFISPSHAWQWEQIAAAGLWPQFEYWKKRMVTIVEEEAFQHSRPPFPLWDFTGYNSVTTEAVPSCGSHEVMGNYLEASHYEPNVGNLVLKRVLGQAAKNVPDDFGVLITPLNINHHLDMIRRDRENWRSKRHADYVEIRLLAARVFGKANTTYDFVCPKAPSK